MIWTIRISHKVPIEVYIQVSQNSLYYVITQLKLYNKQFLYKMNMKNYNYFEKKN